MSWLHRHLPAKQALNSKQSNIGYVRIIRKNLRKSGYFSVGLIIIPILIIMFFPFIVYWILPETKDLGLEMIQSYFIPSKTVFYVDLPLGDEKNKNSNKTDICITNNTDYGSTFV